VLFSLSSLSSVLPFSSGVSCTMNPTYSNHQYEDSHSQNHRSRTNSGASTTQGLFQSLKLVESPVEALDTTSYPSSRPKSSQGLDSPAYISSSQTVSPAFLPAPSSHSQSSFPHISDSALDADWFDTSHAQAPGVTLFRLEPAPRYSRPGPTSSPSSRTTQPASMRCVRLVTLSSRRM
jgi:hypothetical protein